MSIIDYIKQIDWSSEANLRIAGEVFADAAAYWSRVVDHIYKGNEIRADMWMDFSEKQEEIQRLDRKRTEAHNKLLRSAADLIDLLDSKTDFDKSAYRLQNRTQIADFIASIAFEMAGIEPESKVEGAIRDSLAEKIHEGKLTKTQLRDAAAALLSARQDISSEDLQNNIDTRYRELSHECENYKKGLMTSDQLQRHCEAIIVEGFHRFTSARGVYFRRNHEQTDWFERFKEDYALWEKGLLPCSSKGSFWLYYGGGKMEEASLADKNSYLTLMKAFHMPVELSEPAPLADPDETDSHIDKLNMIWSKSINDLIASF